MESTVATLLLVTSAIVLSCIVISYSVSLMQQTVTGDSPQLERIMDLQESLLNETSSCLSQFSENVTQTPVSP